MDPARYAGALGGEKGRSAAALIAFGGLTVLSAVFGAREVRRGKGSFWYRLLRKPKHAPPDWVFGPVWTGLFALQALSGYRIWKQARSPERARALALWGTQLALNTNWTRVFFGRHRTHAALQDLIALWGSLAAYVMQARVVDRKASWMMVPYAGWVTYAGYLNEEIARKNPKFLAN